MTTLRFAIRFLMFSVAVCGSIFSAQIPADLPATAREKLLQRDYEGASVDCNRLGQLEPQSPEGHAIRSLVLTAKGDPPSASTP